MLDRLFLLYWLFCFFAVCLVYWFVFMFVVGLFVCLFASERVWLAEDDT